MSVGGGMTLEEFSECFAKTVNPHLRRGQVAFNLLHAERPEIAWAVENTSLDPFYHDEALPDFWLYVGAHWNESA